MTAVVRRQRTLANAIGALAPPALTVALVAPVVAYQIALLSHKDLLATEGLTSFHANTVLDTLNASLVDTVLPDWLFVAAWLPAYVVPAIGLALMLIRTHGPCRLKADWRTRLDIPIVLFMLVGVSLLSIFQHYIAGVAYLSGRRAIVLFPFFAILCGCLSGREAFQSRPLARVITPLMTSYALVLLSCYFVAERWDRTTTWRYDADTRDMMGDLRSILADWPGPSPGRLGVTWIFEPAINFYRLQGALALLAPVTQKGPMGDYELYYLQTDPIYIKDVGLAEVEASVGTLRLIKRYPRSGAILAVPLASRLTLPGL